MEAHSYHHRKIHKHKRRWRWAVLAFVILVLLVGGLIAYDLYRGRSQQQTGKPKISELVVNGGPKITIDEPSFVMQLPGDWKEVGRVNNQTEYGITWQATKPKEDNRYVTVYIDKIPRARAYNRLLPVEAVGTSLRHGSVSDNCAAYTEGGAIDANSALKAKETLAQWEEVNFMCDLPKVFDNVIGTSSKEGINLVTVSGPQGGTHKYFFIYTDHNIHPNYDIFVEIVKSFKAK